MKFAETINGYNAMGREDAEYEACYAVAERHTVGGLHCHDFYEFYIHYHGGKVYYVDGSVFPLQNNQLIIMPPFRMHGLVGGSSLQNYERGFLYLRPETLRKLGFGQIDYFSQGKAVFVYQGEIRQSMYRLKEKGRGYNQAAVFARTLGEKMNLPVEKRMVKRIRNTTPQKELNDVERKINLKKAFQLVPNIVKYKKILIVDDIYTTGSTIDAVAEVLLHAGVDEIYFLCISIGEGF